MYPNLRLPVLGKIRFFLLITGISFFSFSAYAAPTFGPINGDTVVCLGKTLQLTHNTAGGTWSSSNISSIGTISQTGLFTTGTATGTTRIEYVLGHDTARLWITIKPAASAGVITGDSIVCRGKTLQLTDATPGGTWSSSNISAIGTISQTGLFATGTNTGTTRIEYVVSNGACSDTAVKWITVVAPASAGVITGDTLVCLGKTLQFSNTTPGGTWSSSNISAVGTISQNGLFTTGTNAGTTRIEYVVTNGTCSDTARLWITIANSVSAGVITGDTVVCAGKTLQLSNPATGGVWKSLSPAKGTVSQTGLFTAGNVTGLTRVDYIVTNGKCSDTAVKWITVVAPASAGVITGDTLVCLGKTLQFSNATPGGTWSSSNISAVGTISQTGLFTTGTNAGTTRIEYVVTNGTCSDTARLWITVANSVSAGVITGDTVVCAGKTIQLSNPATGGVWKSLSPAKGTVSQTGLFTAGNVTGLTRVDYVVTNGKCSDTAVKWITVVAPASAGVITGDTLVCLGKTLQFSNATPGGTWSSSNISAVGTISQTGLFTTGTNAGTTRIEYVVTNGTCSDTARLWITVANSVSAGVITGDTVVCAGKTLQLSNPATGGVWKSLSPAKGTVSQTGLFTAGNVTGLTRLDYIVTNGKCSDTAVKWITVVAPASARVITGDTLVCLGKTLQFSNATPGGTWSSSNISAVGTISQTGLFTTGTNAGTTRIEYVVTNGTCSDTARLWITIANSVSAGVITGDTVVCAGKTLQLSNPATGGVWKSLSPAKGTVSQTGLFTAGNVTGLTRLDYIVTNGKCSDTAVKWITVVAPASAGVITGDTLVCLGKTLQFSNTTPGGTWSSSNISAVGTISQTGLFTTGTNAGTTRIEYVVTNGTCSDTARLWITIANSVSAGVITGDTVVCAGKTLQLSNPATGGVWKSLSPAKGTVSQTGLFTAGNVTGLTRLDYIVTNGKCSDTAVKWITVVAPASAGVITGDTLVCLGKTLQFSNTTPGGTWSSSNISAVGTISQTGLFTTGTNAGTTRIEYVVTNGTCSDTARLWITIGHCTYVWTGAVNNNWENSGNWKGGVVPTMGDQVIINAGTVKINSDVTIGSLTLNPGASLTVSPGKKLTISAALNR